MTRQPSNSLGAVLGTIPHPPDPPDEPVELGVGVGGGIRRWHHGLSHVIPSMKDVIKNAFQRQPKCAVPLEAVSAAPRMAPQHRAIPVRRNSHRNVALARGACQRDVTTTTFVAPTQRRLVSALTAFPTVVVASGSMIG